MTDLSHPHHVPRFESDLLESYSCPACPGTEFDTLFLFNRHRRERHDGRIVVPAVVAEREKVKEPA